MWVGTNTDATPTVSWMDVRVGYTSAWAAGCGTAEALVPYVAPHEELLRHHDTHSEAAHHSQMWSPQSRLP